MNTKVLAQMAKMMVFVLSVIIAGVFTSCDKNEELLQTPQVVNQQKELEVSPTSELRSSSMFEEVQVSPKFGQPNSTSYYFRVNSRYASTIETFWVKLYNKATGESSYYQMNNHGGQYFDLYLPIRENGWYDYRYMKGAATNRQNISSGKANSLCNTYNVFYSDTLNICRLTWPFGADGSSWSNRSGLYGQVWKGGQEQKFQGIPRGQRGYGWKEGTHREENLRECFSDDWNRGSGSQDFGAEIRSPLDGYVESVSTYTTRPELGPSKYVSIIQVGPDGRKYRFYVSHLDRQTIKPGTYVQAGITPIGTLGKSGAESPHAHCNLRKDGFSGNSLKFYFNAKLY